MGHTNASLRQSRDIVVAEPDRVGRTEALREEIKVFQMFHQTLAVSSQSQRRLRARLGEMSLERHVTFVCQMRAFGQKFVRAMQRNGRAESRPDPTPVEIPVCQNLSACVDRRRPWRGT